MLDGAMESTIIYGFLTVFSIGLMVISLLSYQKSKNKKILFISGIFIIFLIKGLLLSLSLLNLEYQDIVSIPFLALLDLLILSFLFLAVLKT